MNPLAPTVAGTHHHYTARFRLSVSFDLPRDARPSPRSGAFFCEVGHGEG